jgi:hypothetical protein
MQSFWAIRAAPHYPTRIHPALTGFADECCTLARLLAYVGVLAKAGRSVAARSYPAFAVSQFDLPEKTEAYKILRHPAGGRKDVFRWTTQGEKPVAELEIYRLGGEFDQSGATFAGIAARIRPADGRKLEAAGVIDSKFGAVTLLRHPGEADGARSCLGFFKRPDFCGKPPAARHALIGAPAKMLVFMPLFLQSHHYCDAVWPD